MVLMQLVPPIKVEAAMHLLPVNFYNTVQHGVGCTVLLPDGPSTVLFTSPDEPTSRRKVLPTVFPILDYQLRQEQIN